MIFYQTTRDWAWKEVCRLSHVSMRWATHYGRQTLPLFRYGTQNPPSRWTSGLRFGIPATIITHQKEWIWALAAAWLGFNVGLYFALYTLLISVAGYSVVLGFYGVGKILTSIRTRENRLKWILYLAIVACSALWDYITTQGLLLSTMPFLWLILYQLFQNDQAFITSYFPKWMNFRKPRSLSMSGPGEPVWEIPWLGSEMKLRGKQLITSDSANRQQEVASLGLSRESGAGQLEGWQRGLRKGKPKLRRGSKYYILLED